MEAQVSRAKFWPAPSSPSPVPLPCFLRFAGGKHGFPRIGSVNKLRNKLESEAENKGRGHHIFSRRPLTSAPCPVGNWPLHSSPRPHLPFPAVCLAKIIVQSTASEATSKVGNRVTAYDRRSTTQQAQCWTSVLICRTSSDPGWDTNDLQRLQCLP